MKNRTLKQIKASKIHSKRMTGKGNSMYNKHHSTKTKITIRKKAINRYKDPKNHPSFVDGKTLKPNYCIDCGKELGDYKAKRCKKCSYIAKRTVIKSKCIDCGKLLSKNKYKRCHSCALKYLYKIGKKTTKGKNNPNYINGKGKEPYSSKFNNILKEKIRKRDKYTCQLCDKKQINCRRRLDVHHIDYNKKNCKEMNLITLCFRCNIKVNKNRDIWEYICHKILKNNVNGDKK